MAVGTYDTINRIFDTFAVTSRSRYVFVYDMNKNISRWSLNAVDYFGLTGEYIYNASTVWENRIHPDDRDNYEEYINAAFSGAKVNPNLEYRARNKNGEYVVCSSRGVVIKDYAGKPVFYACSIINKGIVDNNDPITLLPNQYEMLNYMRQLKNQKKQYAILMINFIDFGDINRRYGYTLGNNILRATAKKLLQDSEGKGKVYRGDGTILALISDSMSVDEVKKFYGVMRAFTRDALTIKGKKVGAEIGGGVILASDFDIDEHSIYTSAKYALDFSKTQRHGNLIIFHNDELDNKNTSIEKVDAVRNSVLNGMEGFYLEYQPIVAANNGRLVGMEVFVRWQKEPFGAVSPSEFVPWLEQDQVFYNLGNWILENALKDALEVRHHVKNFYLSVNLAFMQLERSEFRTTLIDILRKTGYPATGLCLELTQGSRQLSMEHLKSQIEFLKSCGVRIGLDVTDFASLDYVRQIPVDLVNIVPALTDGIEQNTTNKFVIEAITSFTHRLRIRTCFTGIEDEETAAIAKQYPVSDLMGYYYGRPCGIDKFKELDIYKNIK
ncbi:sensor domain-containing phosphodiesterase [Butyrivibrio sp. YAB3001]|uniref:sensor domain-containing phosphodiesterase n=1 Tax=Butyrivibrio sp. YAB3001 TaxID=1520812 RepID=UPI0008F67A41|nr:EAL domain-containing protein [Butyrivibrio sp. YAB3001]SFC40824.1 PAS domain S-box-containing protein [Butyrivibrio sp. YAB3001]